MEQKTISAIAGVLLSLALAYVPGLRVWFENLSGTQKRAVLLASMIIVVASVALLSCYNIIMIIPCTKPSLDSLLQSFIWAIVANQTTYQFKVEK